LHDDFGIVEQVSYFRVIVINVNIIDNDIVVILDINMVIYNR